MEPSPDRVVDGFTELLDVVGNEDIANEHRVGIHSNRIDFEEHAKIYSRTQIREEIWWFDRIERSESSVSKNVEFLKESVSETLAESMPALLRGVQLV